MPGVAVWIEISAKKTLAQCSTLVGLSRHVFPWLGSAACQRVNCNDFADVSDLSEPVFNHRPRIICKYAFGKEIWRRNIFLVWPVLDVSEVIDLSSSVEGYVAEEDGREIGSR